MTTSAPYYGDSAVMRTPPPDLPSLLLKERIVYLGLPLFSDDDSKRQMGIDVTELIIAQLRTWSSTIPRSFFTSISLHWNCWYSETPSASKPKHSPSATPSVNGRFTPFIGQAMGRRR